MGSLEGKVVFVTGGGSGMGAAFCRRFAADGAHVVVNDMNETAAGAVAEDVRGEASVFDVTDSAALDAAVDRVVAHHGRLDVMINNAGIAPPPDAERAGINAANQMKRFEGRTSEMEPPDMCVGLSDEGFDRMIKVHLYGVFYGTRAALRHMTPARSGNIVNIASVLGLRPIPGSLHYAAAKAGIIALTKSVGQEVAPFGVRVNAVCPGWVDTPLLDFVDPMMRVGLTAQIPQARMAEPSELAELVRFLSGPESSYCSGDVFTASGGFV